jgi:hypothetical protein
MTFKLFRIKEDLLKDKNRERFEHDLNEFEADLDTKNMQINHVVTLVNSILIVQYRPKPKAHLFFVRNVTRAEKLSWTS